jgi:predicted RNase H-like HicB family nuclease
MVLCLNVYLVVKLCETELLHLQVVIERDEDNLYIVSCPVFKACHSFGKTIHKALERLKQVIEMCIDEKKKELRRLIVSLVLGNYRYQYIYQLKIFDYATHRT